MCISVIFMDVKSSSNPPPPSPKPHSINSLVFITKTEFFFLLCIYQASYCIKFVYLFKTNPHALDCVQTLQANKLQQRVATIWEFYYTAVV
jgi:hypothetical protein